MNLNDAEQLKELVVQPMIDTVRAEIKPLADKVQQHEAQIATLEAKQTKAMVGWGLYATAASLAIGSAWGWLRSKIKWA